MCHHLEPSAETVLRLVTQKLDIILRHSRQKTSKGTDENGQQAEGIQKSSLILIQENSKPQDHTAYTDGQSPKISQGAVSVIRKG